MYVAEGKENVVRMIDRATGIITTFAGNGTAGYSGDGGPASQAELNNPFDIALDSAGNVFIADAWNACIRRVDAKTGILSTVAGVCGVLGESASGGPATKALVILPLGVAVAGNGDLYIADAGLSLVHRVSAATGNMTIFAGKVDATAKGDGGPATEAQLLYTIGLAVDANNNVYIVDSNANDIRRVDGATNIITTVAGTGVQGNSGDGGPATAAELYQPSFITVDGAGDLLFSDSAWGRVRKVDATTGIISTYAGQIGSGFSGDGGPATSAHMAYPEGVGFDGAGNLYISDSFNYRVRVVGEPPLAALIATSTTLKASATTLTAGQALTLTATVAATSGTTPTGTVTFLNGGTTLGSGTLDAQGVATLTLTPAAGVYSITASYAGSASDAGSASTPPIVVTVRSTAVTTTTSLQASATVLTVGQALTLTATVKAAGGAVPSGTVSFLNGNAVLGMATLNGVGAATLTLTPAAGVYSVTAAYAGSASDAGSASAPAIGITVTQTAATTKTTLTASPNPAVFGTSVQFHATVSSETGVPAGSVVFYDGSTLLGQVTLNAGAANYNTSGLSVGSHSIEAVYGGTSAYEGSTSTALTVVITAADFSVEAAPVSRTLYTGEAASFTVAVVPGAGFVLPVSLACSGLPANTTCSFSPASVASGSGTSKLTVQTSAPRETTAAAMRWKGLGGTALAGTFLLCVAGSRRKWPVTMLILMVGLGTALAIGGCGGSHSLTGGTPVGTDTVTVTATAGNGAQTLTHKATVTLLVKSLF